MNKTILIIIAVVVLGGIGILVFGSNKSSQDTAGTSSSSQNTSIPTISEVLGDSRYVEYSKEEFDKASDKKRIYFFHAAWCPSCRVAENEILSNLEAIPEDIVIFKTDYDSERELKNKYGVIYQHTFVQVDENGEEITKWNGGGIAEIIQFTK